MGTTESIKEFDRQVQNLVQRGYPRIAGLTTKKFLEHIEPLRVKVEGVAAPQVDLEEGHLPLVIAIKSSLVDSKEAMSLVVRGGKHGVDIMRPHEPADFKTIEAVDIPSGMAYLLVDIDRGRETLNVTPREALQIIHEERRSALTIDEGIAIVTQYPDFLRKNNCFSLLASRISGNRRVPAIWINAKREPNLGWCWEGNPHTWLGSASCGTRIGA